jgi:hypothetical protein
MIFCARATRGRGLPSLDARSGDHTSRLAECLMHHVLSQAHARVPIIVPDIFFRPFSGRAVPSELEERLSVR